MGNSSSNENAQQQLIDNQPLGNESNANLVVDDQEIKKTFAIKNPIFLKRSTLTIERDAYNNNMYYLSFIYDALLNFDLNIYYNCRKNFQNDLKNFNNQNSIIQGFDFGIFVPTDFFKNKSITKTSIRSGQDIKFFDKSVYLDWNLFSQNKVQDENMIDVVIEMIPIIENSQINNAASKAAFYTLCKFTEENNVVKIKAESQKLFTNNILIDVSDVYNSARETGECLLCFTNPRNTIYLPCKHSCCCKNCSHNLRMRNFPCPMCKNSKN